MRPLESLQVGKGYFMNLSSKWLYLFTLPLVTGCVTPEVHLFNGAPADLQCPSEKVYFREIELNKYEATGCGKKFIYECPPRCGFGGRPECKKTEMSPDASEH